MNHADMQHLNIEFPYRKQYGNFIGGEWVAPVGGEYFDNVSPVTGRPFTAIPRSREADIELALDAAHAAKAGWAAKGAAERANVLLRIADRMEANLTRLAVAETIDNGKPLRRPPRPTCRSRSTTSATSRAASARRKARSPISAATWWPTTSTSRSASSARSSRGTSRC